MPGPEIGRAFTASTRLLLLCSAHMTYMLVLPCVSHPVSGAGPSAPAASSSLPSGFFDASAPAVAVTDAPAHSSSQPRAAAAHPQSAPAQSPSPALPTGFFEVRLPLSKAVPGLGLLAGYTPQLEIDGAWLVAVANVSRNVDAAAAQKQPLHAN